MTSAEDFRLAICGAGMITASMHLPSVFQTPGVRLTAIVDSSIERAQSLADTYGLDVAVSTQVGEVLDRADGVIIATPNHTHADIACECLRAGVSTLIEKPLASNVADAERILEAARLGGATVAVGYLSRFRDSTFLLKELLDANYFGPVRRFARQAGTKGGWAPVSGYNLNRAAVGGGVLVVSGTHFLDTMLHLWGYPSWLELEDDSEGGPEAHCCARFRFEMGHGVVEGTVLSSKLVSLPPGLVIETDRGLVIVGDTDDAEIRFRPNDNPTLEHVVRRTVNRLPSQLPVDVRQLLDFVDACRRKVKPMVDGEQGLLSMRLIEDLYRHRRQSQPDYYAAAAAAAAAGRAS